MGLSTNKLAPVQEPVAQTVQEPEPQPQPEIKPVEKPEPEPEAELKFEPVRPRIRIPLTRQEKRR